MAQDTTKRVGPIDEGRILFTTPEAALLLGVSEAFLEQDRRAPDGPRIPYVQVGKRAVRYSVEELHKYVRQHAKRMADFEATPLQKEEEA